MTRCPAVFVRSSPGLSVSCEGQVGHEGDHRGRAPRDGMLFSWSDADAPRCLARDVVQSRMHPALCVVDCDRPGGHEGAHIGVHDGGVWTWGKEPRTVASALIEVGRAAEQQWPLAGYETADNGNVFAFAVKASPAVVRRTKAALLALLVAPEHWQEHDADSTGIADAARRMAPKAPTDKSAEDRIHEILKRHDQRFYNLTQLARIDIEARRDLEQRTRRQCSEIEGRHDRLNTRVHSIADDVSALKGRIATLERAARRRRWWPWA